MPSILPGFEYDIFISYRHNDNLPAQGAGWVTEFVNALQAELAATLKEPLTIYFDKNPHDGLLETHSVDKSLEGKLKCLIFIPIISQTYCDPKSFAWQHEFCAFNRLAAEDQLGRDIRLTSGNITNRILPIKIHDIDADDKEILEKELGGILRAIEFIYKEAGVNRPLSAHEENPANNQNQTSYRNQVNKVANAIKDIVNGLKTPTSSTMRAAKSQVPKANNKIGRKNMVLAVISLIAVVFLGYILYPKLASERLIEERTKAIAVLPFDDLSPKKDQEYFSDGLAEEIINVLMQIPNVKVVGRASSFSFKGSHADLKSIGAALGASYIIQGSVRKSGNLVKIQVNLMDPNTGFNVKSYSFPETQLDNIFQLQDKIAQSVTSDLKLSLFSMQGEEIIVRQTDNPEALEEFFKGRQLYFERRNMPEAVAHFERAIALDPGYSRAYSALAETWCVLPSYSNRFVLDSVIEKASAAIENCLRINPNSAEAYTAKGRLEWMYQFHYKEGEAAFKKAIALNPNYGPPVAYLGHYYQTFQPEIASEYYLMAITLEPRWVVPYNQLGLVYLLIGDTEHAKKMFGMARDIQPGYQLGFLSSFNIDIIQQDYQAAIDHFDQFYQTRCGQSDCNQTDMETIKEILNGYSKEQKISDLLASKITHLKFTVDRMIFSALVGRKTLLLDELKKAKRTDRFHFVIFPGLFWSKQFRDDPEFIALYAEDGIVLPNLP